MGMGAIRCTTTFASDSVLSIGSHHGIAGCALLCQLATFLVMADAWSHYTHPKPEACVQDELIVCQRSTGLSCGGTQIGTAFGTAATVQSAGTKSAKFSPQALGAHCIQRYPPSALPLRHGLV